MSNKSLMLSKRFWPVFWTQFSGAMNDNVFKNALVILITYQSSTLMNLKTEQMVALCGGIFILPFFLFSAIAGELTDKFSMHKIVRATKILEFTIMMIGAFGFILKAVPLLLFSLFLLGLQATLFGPVKYSILPELITEDELVKGNALVEMGTFLAILIGTIIGGILIAAPRGETYIAVTGLVIAGLGLMCSFQVKQLSPIAKNRKINFNIIQSTYDILKISRKTKSVFISILGISWFWFFGATLLSLFPVYVKSALYGDATVVTFLLAIFSIGVAIGSIICERVSHERLELGLVPFGSIGLSLFVLDLGLAGGLSPTDLPRSIADILMTPGSLRIIIDLALLSIMSGFFIVPLYTFIQTRSERSDRARVIAANNILNALFMVASAGMMVGLYALGLKVTDIFLVLFALNTLVAIYIYTVIPEFLLRFVCVIVTKMIYRLDVVDHKFIPDEGPAVLVCNHVSFVDWLIIAAAVKRPIRFVMHYSFAKIPVLSFFLRGAKVIPIAGTRENQEIMEEAFAKIKETLDEGEIICIFPEGQITYDGKLNTFRPGIERILANTKGEVPVIPMTLTGLWGSFFSRKFGKAASRFSVIPKTYMSKIILEIYPPMKSSVVSAKTLEDFTLMKLEEKKGA